MISILGQFDNDNNMTDEGSSNWWTDEENLLWTLTFVFAIFIFVCLPFCSKHRRNLWLRRIRERRWIEDYSNDWYLEAHRRRQERMRRLEAEQRNFQLSRTQEDEIREQFLLVIMKNFITVSFLLQGYL